MKKKFVLALLFAFLFIFLHKHYVEAETLETFLKDFVGKEVLVTTESETDYFELEIDSEKRQIKKALRELGRNVLKEVGTDYISVGLKKVLLQGIDSKLSEEMLKVRAIYPFHRLHSFYLREGELIIFLNP